MVAVKLKCRKNKNHENSQFRMLIDTLQITTSYRKRVRNWFKWVLIGFKRVQFIFKFDPNGSKWVQTSSSDFKYVSKWVQMK